MLTLWFDKYATWKHVIDRLYVYVNSDSPPAVIDWIRGLTEEHDNTFFIYCSNQIEHGEAIRQMVELSTEDIIMLIEDDAFIVKPDYVDACFKSIESGMVDLLGSKRGSCSQWIYDTASEKWGLDNSGLGDHGPNFWPNFLFAKREDLLKVTNFGARSWEQGEYVKELGAVAPEFQASDTFVEASLQLRDMGLDIDYVKQYHGSTNDEPDYERRENIWDGQCPWFHVGSLSSGFHGMLKKETPIDNEHFSTRDEKLELERRIVFYLWGLEQAVFRSGLPKQKREYYDGIQRLINNYDLIQGRIEQRLRWYKQVFV